MAYSKQTWADAPLTTTPLTAARLNHMEEGIEAASEATEGAYIKPGAGIPKADLVTAVQTSLNKADTALQAAPVTSVATKTGAVTLIKGDVGLGNVDNTSDLNKPISTATQTALNGKANASHTHVAADLSGVVKPADTTVSGWQFVVNENNMASNSQTKLPTQASVKAYVDTQVAAGGGGGGGGSFTITPTSTKTASYTAAAGEYVIVNAVANLTITLPTSPANGSLVAVYIYDGTASVTLACPTGTGGSELLYDNSGMLSMPLQDANNQVGLSLWRYNSTGAFWHMIAFNAGVYAADIVNASGIGAAMITAADAGAVRTLLNVAPPGNKRVVQLTTGATPSFNVNTTDCVSITALDVNIASLSTGVSGTPANFQQLRYRIKDNGTARTITPGAMFENTDNTFMPTSTTPGKTHDMLFEWNSAVNKFKLMAVGSY